MLRHHLVVAALRDSVRPQQAHELFRGFAIGPQQQLLPRQAFNVDRRQVGELMVAADHQRKRLGKQLPGVEAVPLPVERPGHRPKAAKSWQATRELLGGKGAGLFDMTRKGLPVPPGFTLSTEVCDEFVKIGKKLPQAAWEQALAAMKPKAES